MGYKILYASSKNINKSSKIKQKSIRKILIFISAGMIACTILISEPVRNFIMPFDRLAINRATTRLIDTLEEGESIQTAITAFCTEVIDSGLQD